jgi:hypothetical protein
MSLHRQAAKRDDNEGPIIRALEAAGAVVVRLAQPCDLLVYYRREVFLLEVKDPAKPPSARRLTPAQEVYHRRLPITVVLTPEESLRVVGALKPSP